MKPIILVGLLMSATLAAPAALVSYQFTGKLQAFLPQYVPSDASAALKSVQHNDTFFLSFDLDTSAPPGPYFSYYNNAARNIRFTIPTRGVLYTNAATHLRVLYTVNNPYDIRWDVNGVDSTVNMLLWARDFSNTALPNGNLPDPLNLTGFHVNGISEVILFNGVGGNPTLFEAGLVPVPKLTFRQSQGANTISWVTSDLFYVPSLQTSTSLDPAASWATVTNAPVISGLTNTVTVPVPSSGAQFYRLKVQ